MFYVAHRIFRGPRPENMDTILDYNIETILNLESGFYERLTAHKNHESLEALKNEVTPIDIRMSNFFSPTVEELSVIVREILLMGKYHPIYIHCKHGVDRTGMVVAAYRILVQGWELESAINEMYSNGFHKIPYFFWVRTLKDLYKKEVG